jgi:integrase
MVEPRQNVMVPASVPNSASMAKRGMGSVYLRGRIWWISWWVNGVMYQESSRNENNDGTSKSAAVKLLKEKFAAKMGRGRALMVKDLIDDALKLYEEQRPRSYKDFAVPVAKALLDYWKHYKVEQVTTARLQEYRAKRKAKGRAVATINREMAFLRLAFRNGAKTTPPKVAVLPYFPMEAEDNARQGFLEPRDYERLRDAMPEDIRGLFIIAYHVGNRKGELLKLRWNQVDLEGGFIRFEPSQTKSKRAREVPIYGEMKDCLEALRRETPSKCPWVFNRSGRQIKSFRASWIEACEKADAPGLLFHDLRRSAVRNMVNAGISEHTAMSISGHRTREVFSRYAIITRDDKKDAGKKLAEHLEQTKANKTQN